MTYKILYDSAEAAHIESNTVWVSSRGNHFLKEHHARRDGCTHIKCHQCDNYTEKYYTLCELCRVESKLERYLNLEEKEWDCENYVYSNNHDKFFNFQDLLDYTEEYQTSSADMQLIICVPVKLFTIPDDYWIECLPEDMDLPDDIVEELDTFNQMLLNYKPISWEPGPYRVKT